MKKSAAIGNRKLSDFSELRGAVIDYVDAVRRLREWKA